MAEDEKDPPLSEPIIVTDVFATGVDVERVDGEVRLIAWVTHSDEHRIVNRLVLPDSVARALIRDLRKALASGSN
jgi:ribosomal protein S25